VDIKQYITSGILELYVLSRLTPEETREVEANAAEYPEIWAEIEQIELALEGLAMALAPDVSPGILDKVILALPATDASGVPATPPSGSGTLPKSFGSGWLSSLLAWSVALAFLLGAIYLYLGNQKINDQNQELQEEMQNLKEDCEETEAVLLSSEQRLRDLTNPATRSIVLAGTDNHPDNSAIVFYNTATNKTFFTPSNIPPPPSGKQYQLWAIDADGPKDLGVLALDMDSDDIIEVDFLHGVAAFAITLEDEGGKPAPDLEQLRMIGEVGQG